MSARAGRRQRRISSRHARRSATVPSTGSGRSSEHGRDPATRIAGRGVDERAVGQRGQPAELADGEGPAGGGRTPTGADGPLLSGRGQHQRGRGQVVIGERPAGEPIRIRAALGQHQRGTRMHRHAGRRVGSGAAHLDAELAGRAQVGEREPGQSLGHWRAADIRPADEQQHQPVRHHRTTPFHAACRTVAFPSNHGSGAGMSRVLLSAPDIGSLEEEYLLRAVRSGWVAPAGPDLAAFEDAVAHRSGTAAAVGVCSGTAALHLALLGLGVGPGDVVLVPTLTFVATANAAVYTGAEPLFVDCTRRDGNVDVDLVAAALADLAAAGRRVAAVLPVDLFGACADYAALLPVCAAAGVPVVEDAAEALGATRAGRAAGSFGRVGAFSFNGNKILTTSGGGMLVSDDLPLLDRCRYLATQARQPVPWYEHLEIGYNYRLSNLLAALGRAQLLRLDAMVRRRRWIRDRYRELFAGVAGVRLLGAGDLESNCWLTCVVVEPDACGWRAADLAADLSAADIETRPMWRPMHRQPVFAGARTLLTGAADHLYRNGLALPSGSALTDAQVGTVLDRIGGFLRARRADRRQPAGQEVHR
jgi:dTDP-4-amino-4,6-dideoxygalactose transaminase